MNWDAIGAIGEVAGAVGVIVTLVYLATQLRQNTKALRSSTYQAFNESSFSWADSLLEHSSKVSEILASEVGERLTPDQQTILTSLMMKTFTVMESSYLHHRAGALDDDVFEAKMRSSVRFIADSPLVLKEWQRAIHFYGVTPGFKEHIDKRLQALGGSSHE